MPSAVFSMCVAEKAAIFQQQGVSRKVVPELIDQFLFAVVVAAHGHGNFDMRTSSTRLTLRICGKALSPRTPLLRPKCRS